MFSNSDGALGQKTNKFRESIRSKKELNCQRKQ
jgi:hypothetical protein